MLLSYLQKVCELQALGVVPTEAETRNVNILSDHIERITMKRLKKKNIVNVSVCVCVCVCVFM